MTGFSGCLAALAAGLLVAGLQPSPPQALPRSALPLRLTGVIVDNETPARSACLIRCADGTDRRGMFFAGQQACDLAEIQEVREDGVVIKNLGMNRAEFLIFSATNAPVAAQPPAGAQPLPAPQILTPAPEVIAVDLARGEVDGYLKDLPGLLASALATPRYRDIADGKRVVDGYEIGQVKAAGIADRLGLRNGDVILEVNGEALDGMATVMRLFGQLQTRPQTRVTVLRNGQRMAFVFNMK